MNRDRLAIAVAVGLALALVLALWRFGGAGGGPGSASDKRPVVGAQPNRLLGEQRARLAALAASAQAAVDGGAPALDPLLAAIPTDTPRVAVFEVQALRQTKLGALILPCVPPKERRLLADFQEKTGIDPLADVDRFALTPKVAAISGLFAGHTPWAVGNGGNPAIVGAHGMEYQFPNVPPEQQTMLTWGEGLALWGPSDSLHAAVARLEGRLDESGALLTPDDVYGDAYGVFLGADFAQLLPASLATLADALTRVADRVVFHLDAKDDVALTLDVTGRDAAALETLGKDVESALASAKTDLSPSLGSAVGEMLSDASVTRASGHFVVSMVVAIPSIADALGDCAKGAGK